MKTLAVLLLLPVLAFAGPPVKFDPPAVLDFPTKPVVEPAPIILPAGYHEHQCPACGTRWGHGEEKFGERAAHTCPNCGRVQWQVAPGIKLYRLVPSKRVSVSCPTNT